MDLQCSWKRRVKSINLWVEGSSKIPSTFLYEPGILSLDKRYAHTQNACLGTVLKWWNAVNGFMLLLCSFSVCKFERNLENPQWVVVEVLLMGVDWGDEPRKYRKQSGVAPSLPWVVLQCFQQDTVLLLCSMVGAIELQQSLAHALIVRTCSGITHHDTWCVHFWRWGRSELNLSVCANVSLLNLLRSV